MNTSQPENVKFTVGWVCALPVEMAAAKAMLDQKYDLPVPSHPGDTNIYTLGRIGGHQVVITSLPAGKTGVTAAAVVATRMLADFPDIRFGLMVGIGGGIPSDEHDIRLGDVVVSQPQKVNGGVVQFDLGKATDKGFVRTGSLNQPPAILLSALANIQAEYFLEPEKFPQYIQDAAAKFPKARKQFTYMGTEQDRLFEADYSHVGGSKTCADCDSSRIVTREARQTTVPLVHYGTIASSNQVIKNAATRDRLGQEHGAMCFEMEAAGLMDGFPCLVIRGICDYSDSHKNDQWQAYAAVAAAAYTKDLLSFISPAAVEVEEKAARLLKNIQQDVSKIHEIAKEIEEKLHNRSLDRKQDNIVKWISNLDPSEAYTQAHKERHPGTGRWFVDGDTFAEWKSQSSGFLWLHGIPGCGKTILVSTIIEALEQDKTSLRALLYFFFDFRTKFDLEKLIRSLMGQLYRKRAGIQHHLDKLWTYCEDGHRQPSLNLLKSTFSEMLRQTHDVSIVLDALDESESRRELLDWIEVSHTEAQFLVTSRKEADIDNTITSFLQADKMVSLQKSDVDRDIAAYIRHVVTHDKDLRRWRNRPEVQEEIETTLAKKAGGMFKWAVLQIEKLKDCINYSALHETLQTLPEDLFKTYDRILDKIPKMHREQACTMLMLMAWSERPLRQEEVVDAIAIRLKEEPCFNETNRLPEATDLIRLCPGLVESRDMTVSKYGDNSDSDDDSDSDNDNDTNTDTDNDIDSNTDICQWPPPGAPKKWFRCVFRGKARKSTNELWLAHFSVKEYLIHNCKEEPYHTSLQESNSMVHLATICLMYLSQVGQHGSENRTSIPKLIAMFPFFRYASQYWTMFVRSAEGADAALQQLVLQFLQPANPSLVLCWLFYTSHLLWELGLRPGLFHPLLYASLHGLKESVENLWEQARPNSIDNLLTSVALHAASALGFEDVVQLLLSKGVPANTRVVRYGTCLQTAAHCGHVKVVEALLQGGADINERGGWMGTALYSASVRGHVDVAKLLLNWHAIINIPGELYGRDLQAEPSSDRRESVELFVRSGANINLQGTAAYGEHDSLTKYPPYSPYPSYGNALHAAIIGDHMDLADCLLAFGADVNAKGGHFGNALQAACFQGHQQLVKKLLDQGADINAHGGGNCTALQAAVWRGHEDLVRFLIEKGAAINTGCECRRTSLDAALSGDSIVIMQLLLDHGAEVSPHTVIGMLRGPRDNRHKSEEIIPRINSEHVLQKDEAHSKTILHWAAETGYENVVSRCLELGADVQARDRYGETALHYAAENGHLAIAKLLVEGGSKIGAIDGHGRTPLACAQGRGLEQERSCHSEVIAYLEEIIEQQKLKGD